MLLLGIVIEFVFSFFVSLFQSQSNLFSSLLFLFFSLFLTTKIPITPIQNPKPKEFAQNLPLVNSSTEKITLRNLRLQSLPHDIFLVTNLVELDLESNDFEVLSEGISYLSNLESLNLRKNRLPHLPAALGQLTTLKTLSLSHNRLKHFPAVLCRLRNLLVLHLDHNLIQKVPSSLFWFPELKELHLNNNQLTCVPESIGKFFFFVQNRSICKPFKISFLQENLNRNCFLLFHPFSNHLILFFVEN